MISLPLAGLGGLATAAQIALADPPVAPPNDFAWFWTAPNPWLLVTAGFSGLGAISAIYTFLQPTSYTAKKGQKDREHQNDSFGALDRRMKTGIARIGEGQTQTIQGIAELHAKIDAMAAQIGESKPDQATSFAEAAGKLVDSGDEEDIERARAIAEGRPEDAADTLMADVHAGKSRNAERARQAARIYAPFAPGKAKTAYEEAVALDPTDFWSWIELGRMRAQYDGIASARACFAAGLQHAADERDEMVLHVEFGKLLLAEGQLYDARSHYTASLTIAERRAAARPDEIERLRDLSVNFDKLGDIEISGGNLVDARTRFEEARAIAGILVAKEPNNLEWMRDLLVCCNKLGNVDLAIGDLDQARARFEEGYAIVAQLSDVEPDTVKLKRDLSISYNRLGDLEVEAGNLAMARSRFEESQAIVESLVAAEPDNGEWQHDLAVTFDRLGTVELTAGNIDSARAHFKKNLAISEFLATADSDNAEWQCDLSVSYNRLGIVEFASRDLTLAQTLLEKSHAIAKRIAAAEPDHAGRQYNLSISNERLGAVQEAKYNPGLALDHYRAAEKTLAALAKRWPDDPKFAHGLATVQNSIIRVLSGQSR
ncbi:tetratricopeptide repeat protein [Parerythrobacter lacustris]|uniref:Tetratricopeptide repeat protein n=1 Tax=Parerythrobacter lacustris TaxID=2969984 RepID=A0ABT1XNJ2_9SPHN|nr:tetratricopeptide repeat protein [Parerythrobacter lacustris]MCR2833226.1 hypothetical protein [Parerythrobacter lacustris]